MRTSILRGFISTAKAPMFENADGEITQLAGDVDPVPGCSESLALDFHGERLSASVTPVRAGDTVVLKRGDGTRDLRETFSEEGILLTIPVPARRELLSALRGRAVPLAIDFQGTSGGYRRGPGGREVCLAMSARIAGVSLAATPEDADCLLSLID